LVAFTPLYILGFMGATRRLDHYDPSLGWQGLFIVAGLGVALICIGVAFQLLQVVVSIWKRNENRVGSDPWDARTLEWSTGTPAPEYVFATIPTVTTRDAFWEMKQGKTKHKEPEYEDIWLPKNSGAGIIIGMFALIFGAAIIWHMWWLVVIGFIGAVVTIIIKLSDDEPDYKISAAKVAKHELEMKHKLQEKTV